MLLIACFLLASGSAQADCPIDLLTVADGTVAWDGVRLDAALVDIQTRLGHTLDLKAVPDWPGLHSSALVGDRPVRLTFHEVRGVLQLSSMWIKRIDSDSSACWERESILVRFKHGAPTARYLPSRHQPDELEASNESPVYALDDRNDVVVMFKSTAGGFYVGHLNDLD